MISIIVHINFDTEERIKNCKLVYQYYINILPESQFIFVEEGLQPDLHKHIVLREKDKHTFILNNGVYNKCKAYNKGALLADNNILLFIDIDTVVSKQNIDKAVNILDNNSILICYNGTAIYLTYKAKQQISEITYSELCKFLPSNFTLNCITNFKTDLFSVGNTSAVGGSLMMTKQCFEYINGFNPKFTGWGFEDNEIVIRCHKLGKQVMYINTVEPYLFHLPHHETEIDKSKHSYYSYNETEFKKIQLMDKNEVLNYIQVWNLI